MGQATTPWKSTIITASRLRWTPSSIITMAIGIEREACGCVRDDEMLAANLFVRHSKWRPHCCTTWLCRFRRAAPQDCSIERIPLSLYRGFRGHKHIKKAGLARPHLAHFAAAERYLSLLRRHLIIALGRGAMPPAILCTSRDFMPIQH